MALRGGLSVAPAGAGVRADVRARRFQRQCVPLNVVSRNSGWCGWRSTDGLPIYRFALRAYVEQILRNRKNLWWSIEGGGTRTGKLRPPRYGLHKYVVDAVRGPASPRPHPPLTSTE